jgi:hypothetical protein
MIHLNFFSHLLVSLRIMLLIYRILKCFREFWGVLYSKSVTNQNSQQGYFSLRINQYPLSIYQV